MVVDSQPPRLVPVPREVGMPPAMGVVEPGRELREDPVVHAQDQASQFLSWTLWQAAYRVFEQVAVVPRRSAALGGTAATGVRAPGFGGSGLAFPVRESGEGLSGPVLEQQDRSLGRAGEPAILGRCRPGWAASSGLGPSQRACGCESSQRGGVPTRHVPSLLSAWRRF